MLSQEKQRWQVLCAQASKEQDSGKLMKVIGELNRALTEKYAARPKARPST